MSPGSKNSSNQKTVSTVASAATQPESGTQSVTVALRLRPLTEQDTLHSVKRSTRSNKRNDSDASRAWSVQPGSPGAIVQKGARKTEGKSLFYFDSVFGEESSTKAVYDAIGKPMVQRVIDGHHGTIFAYGQTSAGKTHTMQGGDPFSKRDGMIQMVAEELFKGAQEQSDREFSVRVSYIEIYNERLYELLQPDAGSATDTTLQENTSNHPLASPELFVRDDPRRGGVFVNCREVEVTDTHAMIEQLRIGTTNRVVSSTAMNDRTSRSHAIFRISVKSRIKTGAATDEETKVSEDDRVVRISVLNLVDLAGSENSNTAGVKGLRHREAGKINQSLLSLSQVIHSLSLPLHKRPAYINYRDSKLTRILQNSLSGDALMTILCCASASKLFVEETRSTLKFAARAKLVQTDSKVNEVVDDSLTVKRLQGELNAAKRSLEALEKRERVSEDTASEAIEELKNLKSMLFGASGGPELSSRSGHQHRNGSHVPANKKSKHGSPVRSVRSTDSHKRRDHYQVNIDSLPDGDSYGHSEVLGYGRAAKRVRNRRRAYDEFRKNRQLFSYADELREQDEHYRNGVDSLPKTSDSHPPPDEVIVMKEGLVPTGRWGNVSLEYKLHESQEQVQFLESKLDSSEDLIELLFKDIEDARRCIHELAFKNVSVVSKNKKLRAQLQVEQHKAYTEMAQQYTLLKFCMYLCLIFFFFGKHELFLVAVMFIWLSLEAYTSPVKVGTELS